MNEITLYRVDARTIAVVDPSQPGITTHVTALPPRKRDFLRVLFGWWEPYVQIRAMGIGQFVSPDARYPATRR